MEIKIMGIRFRPMIVILCLVIGMLIGGFVLCSCAKVTIKQVKEEFENYGAPTNYNMGGDVPGGIGTRKYPSIAQQLDANTGPKLPLPPGQLFFYANNTFKPECCVPPAGSVSSSDGCACLTQEQVDYINGRGGNRSCSDVF